MKYAQEHGGVNEIPKIKPLKVRPKTRPLATAQDIDRLCDAAMKVSKNGEQFRDDVRLMACCGSRRDETLRLK